MIANESSRGECHVEAWGRILFRNRRLVLALAGLGVIVAAVWGTGVFGALQSAGGFAPPNSQSQRKADLAARTFGQGAGDAVVLYTSKTATVHSAAYRSAVTGSLSRLPHDRVVAAQTYWSTGSPQFASANGKVSYAVLVLAGNTEATRIKNFNAISDKLSAPGLLASRSSS